MNPVNSLISIAKRLSSYAIYNYKENQFLEIRKITNLQRKFKVQTVVQKTHLYIHFVDSGIYN